MKIIYWAICISLLIYAVFKPDALLPIKSDYAIIASAIFAVASSVADIHAYFETKRGGSNE